MKNKAYVFYSREQTGKSTLAWRFKAWSFDVLDDFNPTDAEIKKLIVSMLLDRRDIVIIMNNLTIVHSVLLKLKEITEYYDVTLCEFTRITDMTFKNVI